MGYVERQATVATAVTQRPAPLESCTCRLQEGAFVKDLGEWVREFDFSREAEVRC